MIVVDARRRVYRAPLRSWRRRLAGAVDRALRSPTPTETWRSDLPALSAAAQKAWAAYLAHEHHVRGRDVAPSTIDEMRVERERVEPIIGAVMGPARAAKLLNAAGIDLGRAMRVVDLVGGSVAEAVAWLDVIDVVALDDEKRGTA